MEPKSYLGAETEPVAIPTSDEKTMALLSHVLTLVAGFVAPLIIYLLKKDQSSFIAEHARESLNFQITIFIIIIALFITVIGILLIWLVGIASLVLVIIATTRASEGKLYRYPFSIRLIKS
jgi:uncharacterized Tic20 family protein